MFGCAYFGEAYFGDEVCGFAIVVVPVVKGELGCGSYEAYILTRGGGSLVAQIPWSQVEWARTLDDTSQATVLADACTDLLSGVRPWRHELVIYRGGEQVWVGPVVTPSTPVQSDHVQYQVVAKDLSAWWDHRLLHFDHDYSLSPTDLAQIFQDFVTDAMSVDNTPGIVVTTTPCGVLSTLAVLAAQHQMAGLELRDLASTGIDWTVLVRDVLAGGAAVPVASIGTFRDEHFALPPVVNLDGTAQANTWGIRGAGGGAAGDTVYGTASDAALQTLDGVLESVDTVSTIQDSPTAQAAAMTRLALTGAVLAVEQAVLAPSAPFDVNALVPGALCDLALEDTEIPVMGAFRLQSVDGIARSMDGTEKITLVFQPVGSM